MPRVGYNPMKRSGQPHVPKPITLVTTVFIPELTGYWEESLNVLRVCLESVFENTDLPFDLLVWDNASCPEVRDYLMDLHTEGKIQYLFLSHNNVAKIGCFNTVFPGIPGEYIGYFDSDVKFYPGWLSATLKVFNTFENVGMVTARPARNARGGRDRYSSTLAFAERAENGLIVERGDFIPADVLSDHFRSLGIVDPDFRGSWEDDIRLTLGDVSVFVWGAHWQFVTKRSVAREILPLPKGDRVLGCRPWDIHLNSKGYLKLGLDQVYVRHIGNSLEGEDARGFEPTEPRHRSQERRRKAASTSLKRRIMLKAHKMLTEALYKKVG